MGGGGGGAHLCGAFIQKTCIHCNICFTLLNYIITILQSISYLTTEAEQNPVPDIIINCVTICAYRTNTIQLESMCMCVCGGGGGGGT